MREDDFIPGIYNYCDRWCERCPKTARCRVFAMEPRDEPPEARDMNNEAFWHSIGDIFKETATMLRQWADELGVDLDAVDTTDIERRHRRLRRKAKQHPLNKLSFKYLRGVDRWFKRHQRAFEAKGEELISHEAMGVEGLNPLPTAIRIGDACDVVRWYQFQINVKFVRALSHDDEHDVVEPAESDATGSAKVALTAVDRSIAAWTVLRDEFPNDKDDVLDLLRLLASLRQMGEAEFPLARAFVRPGFDDGQ